MHSALTQFMVNERRLLNHETLTKMMHTCDQIERVEDRAFLILHSYALTKRTSLAVS